MIGTIMMARMIPEVRRSEPLPAELCGPMPRKNRRTGTFGMTLAMGWPMSCDKKGPKVSTPHSPMTTLGMPANTSKQKPMALDSRGGSFSTTMTAVPIPTGTAITMAMSEDCSVPTISGSAP